MKIMKKWVLFCDKSENVCPSFSSHAAAGRDHHGAGDGGV